MFLGLFFGGLLFLVLRLGFFHVIFVFFLGLFLGIFGSGLLVMLFVGLGIVASAFEGVHGFLALSESVSAVTFGAAFGLTSIQTFALFQVLVQSETHPSTQALNPSFPELAKPCLRVLFLPGRDTFAEMTFGELLALGAHLTALHGRFFHSLAAAAPGGTFEASAAPQHAPLDGTNDLSAAATSFAAPVALLAPDAANLGDLAASAARNLETAPASRSASAVAT